MCIMALPENRPSKGRFFVRHQLGSADGQGQQKVCTVCFQGCDGWRTRIGTRQRNSHTSFSLGQSRIRELVCTERD